MGEPWIKKFEHVVHATEGDRRSKFVGCVSRQTLRRQLFNEGRQVGMSREEAFKNAKIAYKNLKKK